MILAIALLFTLAQSPYQGEIRERLNKPIIATFKSSKPFHDLEICVADAASIAGIPIVLRDGAYAMQMMFMSWGGNAYNGSITFTKIPEGTRLDMRVRNQSIDGRVKSRVESCL